MLRQGGPLLLFVTLSILLLHCGGPSAKDLYQTGRFPGYLPGLPAFDMEAIPAAPEAEPGFELYLSVPSASLTFEKWGSQYRAMQEIRVALYTGDEDERTFVLERTWTDTTAVSSYAATQRHDPFLLHRRIEIQPGEYEVEVTLHNVSSGQSEARSQRVTVRDPADRAPFLGSVVVRARTEGGKFLPVVPFVVPSGLDSLHCAVTAYHLSTLRRSLATFDLVRYKADTAAALPPMAMTTIDLPLGFGTIDFEEPETIHVAAHPIEIGRSEEELVLSLRGLPAGNYKAAFQVQTVSASPSSGDTVLYAERFISLGGPAFPRPSTLPELIESMEYIARRREMEHLRESPDPETARARFDSLWLSFRQDKSAAAALINKYYSRVEEANRRFTSTKEGWRTDQGMVFIILGPPIEVMNTKDRQVWYYDLGSGDAVNVYTFQRRFVREHSLYLQSYILFRQTYYENFWTRMVERWRTGEVF